MSMRRLWICVAVASSCGLAQSEEPKVVPALPIVKARSAEDKPTKDDNKKKEAEEARKEQEAQEKAQRDYEAAQKKALEAAQKSSTHKQIADIKLTGKNGNTLQTLAVDPSGRVFALVAQGRYFNATDKKATSEIHVLAPDGKAEGVWTVPFHANSLNAGPDGSVYVAGDGRVAKFSKEGKLMGEVLELPFIAEMLKDSSKLKDAAEKQLKAQRGSFDRMTGQYKERLAKLEEKEKKAKASGEELNKTEVAMMKQYKQILDSFKDQEAEYAKMTVETILQGMLSRVKIISSISINEKEAFIVCGENEGYGFGLWRMDLDFKNAKKIMTNISGCCGQMDVQCCDNDLIVAENTKHRFARYDRDGKELFAGGKRAGDGDVAGFGGCCNPMNVKACGANILTSESEGIVKLFGPAGEFKAVVGTVNISGGCKNVAIGTNADASRIYFCDQPGGRVLILAKKDETK